GCRTPMQWDDSGHAARRICQTFAASPAEATRKGISSRRMTMKASWLLARGPSIASDLDPGQARLDSGHVLIGKAHLGRAVATCAAMAPLAAASCSTASTTAWLA